MLLATMPLFAYDEERQQDWDKKSELFKEFYNNKKDDYTSHRQAFCDVSFKIENNYCDLYDFEEDGVSIVCNAYANWELGDGIKKDLLDVLVKYYKIYIFDCIKGFNADDYELEYVGDKNPKIRDFEYRWDRDKFRYNLKGEYKLIEKQKQTIEEGESNE